MTIDQLLESLAEDPFNDGLRSDLAHQYFQMALWQKAHKQLVLVKKQRPLSEFETDLLVDCLRQLGFDDEADAMAAVSGSSAISDPDQLSRIEPVSNTIPLFRRQQTGSEPSVQPAFSKTAVDLSDATASIEGFESSPVAEVSNVSSLHFSARPEPVESSEPQSERKVVSIASATPKRIRFSDIGGLADVKKTIRLQIVEPFINPGMFAKFGKKAGGGVLLYGPPGCGKTMIAKAIAGECEAEFIPVSISDVLSHWIGESESNMAEVFEKARARKPCVLFFDELDALAYSRSKSNSDFHRSLINEFLNQMDGVDSNNENVLILAATNMPWDVDAAMKRPGRFSRMIFVPPPDDEAKLRILQLKLHNLPVESFDYEGLVSKMKLFSGADMDGLIEKAKERVIEEIMETGRERKIALSDFLTALASTQPSTEDWLRTAKNLVKFSGADRSYQAVEFYLKKNGIL